MRLALSQVKKTSPILQIRDLSYKSKTMCWRLVLCIAEAHLKHFRFSGSCFKNLSNFESPSWGKKWVNVDKNNAKLLKSLCKEKLWVLGVLRLRLSTSLKYAEHLLFGILVAGGWVAFHSRILWWCFEVFVLYNPWWIN